MLLEAAGKGKASGRTDADGHDAPSEGDPDIDERGDGGSEADVEETQATDSLRSRSTLESVMQAIGVSPIMELEVKPEQALAWSNVTFSWGDYEPEEYDYLSIQMDEIKLQDEVAHHAEEVDVGFTVTFFRVDFHFSIWRRAKDDTIAKMKDKGWHWIENEPSLEVRLEQPGTYQAVYYSGGGRLSSGTRCGELRFEVEDPIDEFELSAGIAEASAVVQAEWTLNKKVHEEYAVVLRVKGNVNYEDNDSGGVEDPILDVVLMKHSTKKDSTGRRQGQCDIAVPRARGNYQVVATGNGKLDGALRKRPLEVIDPEHSDVTLRIVGTDAEAEAGVFMPGGILQVEYFWTLAEDEDAICLVGGRFPPKIVRQDKVIHRISGKHGKHVVRVPETPGKYCICLCARYRSSHLLPATHCYLFVQEAIAKPDFSKLGPTEMSFSEIIDYEREQKRQKELAEGKLPESEQSSATEEVVIDSEDEDAED